MSSPSRLVRQSPRPRSIAASPRYPRALFVGGALLAALEASACGGAPHPHWQVPNEPAASASSQPAETPVVAPPASAPETPAAQKP